MPPVPDGATVLLVGTPVSHVVPLMPGENHRFVGVNGWSTAEGPRRDAAVAALSRSAGIAWAIVLRGQGAEALVGNLGWTIDETRCTPVNASLSSGNIDLCPVVPNPSGS